MYGRIGLLLIPTPIDPAVVRLPEWAAREEKNGRF
ncbi:hypothetical protein DESC_750008 [Desulfosarcina cetonica]|nr:hypothetical protein DESC_750008 [Desulfosarcina cetonica]